MNYLYNKRYFENSISDDQFRTEFWKELTKYLQKKYFPKEVGCVLDLGCGNGHFINNVRANYREAVDISTESEKCVDKKVNLFIGDVSSKNYDQFDVVFSSNLFEHLEKPKLVETLNYIKLRKEGRLILLLPNFNDCYKEFYDEFTHVTPLTPRSMTEVLEQTGFKVIRITSRFLPYSVNESNYVNLIPKFLIRPLTRLYLSFGRCYFGKGQMLIVAERNEK